MSAASRHAADSGLIRRIGVRQRYENDCGPAALVTVLRYFGASMSVGRVRSSCASRTGALSLEELLHVAHSAGLSPMPLELGYNELSIIQLPSILLLDAAGHAGHYVVACGVTEAGVEVWDPATGAGIIAAWEMRRRWSPGYALCFQMGPHTLSLDVSD